MDIEGEVRLSPDREIHETLKDCWVVILLDPDDSGWSPWSVIASDEEKAIDLARRDWREWFEEDEDGEDGEDCDRADEVDEPEVLKVYRNSWIGEMTSAWDNAA